jgi:hypothetical protein
MGSRTIVDRGANTDHDFYDAASEFGTARSGDKQWDTGAANEARV